MATAPTALQNITLENFRLQVSRRQASHRRIVNVAAIRGAISIASTFISQPTSRVTGRRTLCDEWCTRFASVIQEFLCCNGEVWKGLPYGFVECHKRYAKLFSQYDEFSIIGGDVVVKGQFQHIVGWDREFPTAPKGFGFFPGPSGLR